MKYLKYILLSCLIIIPCIFMILIYNDKITRDAPVYYKKGTELYNKGKYSEAYYYFGKINKISPIYHASLFKQAKSAQKQGDYKMAAFKYDMYLKKEPDGIFSKNARLNLAKSCYYNKDYDCAKKEFEKLSARTDNKGTAETIYSGLIEKNFDKEKAAVYYRQYLETALSGNALDNNYILSAAQELSSLGIELSNEDIKLIGRAYFKERRYNEALKYFSKLPVSDCLDYLIISDYYTGNKKITKKLIEEGLNTEYAKNAEEDNLRLIYNIYASYSGRLSRAAHWRYLEKTAAANSLKGMDYILYKLAECLSSSKAETLYTEIYQKYPDSIFAPEALWQVIRQTYKRKDYTKAEILAVNLLKKYHKSAAAPKAAYWLGKIYLKQNKKSEAHNIFNRLISKYPDNYYALRAENLQSGKNYFRQTSSRNKLPEKIETEFPASPGNIELKDLKLINTLSNAGDYEIFLDLNSAFPDAASRFEYKKGNKSRSIVLARDAIAAMEMKPDTENSLYKLAYPVYMAAEINAAGSKLDIDPLLIAAVIREESYYNEHALSRTGARGLMQLMPKTSEYMLKKLNMPLTADIEDARTNLYLGSNYLRYLKNRFNNDDLMVIAAYNGGEGSVNRWLKNAGSDFDADEFIEDIPYDETRNYVKKVFRTYHMYKKIYKQHF